MRESPFFFFCLFNDHKYNNPPTQRPNWQPSKAPMITKLCNYLFSTVNQHILA